MAWSRLGGLGRMASDRRRRSSPALTVSIAVVLALVACRWAARGLSFLAPPTRTAQQSPVGSASIGFLGLPLGLSALAGPAAAITKMALVGVTFPPVPTPNGGVLTDDGDEVFIDAPMGLKEEPELALSLSGDVFKNEVNTALQALDFPKAYELVSDAIGSLFDSIGTDAVDGSKFWDVIGYIFFVPAGIANFILFCIVVYEFIFGNNEQKKAAEQAAQATELLRQRRLATEAEDRALLGDSNLDLDSSRNRFEEDLEEDEEIVLAAVPSALAGLAAAVDAKVEAKLSAIAPGPAQQAQGGLALPPKKRGPMDAMPEFKKSA